jgi:probable HAF family extracellular repeat protein
MKMAVRFALTVAFLASLAHAVGTYTLTDLGLLGTAYSYGYGLNNAQQVTGYSAATGSGDHPFIFLSGSGLTDIGTLGGTMGYGYSINATGKVAGYAFTAGNTSYHAFSYSTGSGMTDLGTLGGNLSIGYFINGSGQVVGVSDRASGPQHAFIDTPGSGMLDIGTLSGMSAGYGINDSGMATGVSVLPSGLVQHAFKYTTGGGMIDIGTLGGDGSTGYAINNAGLITGTAQTTGDASSHAFLYSSGPGMVDLGTLGLGSTGYAINASGVVVGISTNMNLQGRATLFTGGSAYDLNNLVDSSAAGWTLTQARGINDNGDIAGFGVFQGQARGFLLTPVVSAWTDLGSGKAGISGTPMLTGTGTLAAGSSDQLDLTNAKASAANTLVFGVSLLNAPFKGGTLVPTPLLTFPLPTDPAGAASLPFVMPAGLPSGVALYFQCWIQDPAASSGLAASNGLKGITP